MKKEEFLSELERRLSGISEEERTEAMAFYRSYLEDAGEENEEGVIAELESPEKVAESILSDLGVDTQEKTDYATAESATAKNSNGDDSNTYYNEAGTQQAGYYNNDNQSYDNSYANQPKKDNTTTILIIIIAILTSPIWGSVLLIVASVILGLVCALFGIALAIVAVMVSLIVVGVALGVAGIATIVSGVPAVGIGLIGGGCIVLALGILALIAMVWIVGAFLPWAGRGIWKLCKMPFDKRKGCVAS